MNNGRVRKSLNTLIRAYKKKNREIKDRSISEFF